MTLNSQLTSLESAGLIRLVAAHPEVEYLFRHALLQDTAYATLVKSERQSLHQAAGEALEGLFADRLAELAPQLGHHFYEAGDEERALKYLTAAAGAAAAVYANAEAVAYYRHALEIARHFAETRPETPAQHAASPRHADRPRHASHTPHPDHSLSTATLLHLYLKCGRALETMNRYPEAIALYQEMDTFAQAQADAALELAAVMAQTTAHLVIAYTLDPVRAQALLDRALRLARTLGDRPAEAKIDWQQMLMKMVAGFPREAISPGERALALARELGLREQMAFVLGDLSRVYLANHQTSAALAALTEAEGLWRELGNLPNLADSLGMAAGVRFDMGQFAESMRLTAEFDKISESANSVWGKALGGQFGIAQFEFGDANLGLARLEEGLRLSESGRFGFGMMIMPAYLALAYESLGAFEQGLDYARRAVANAAAAAPFARRWVLPLLARLLLANGRLDEAQAVADSAGSRADLSRLEHYARQTDCLLALAQGDNHKALALADEAISVVQLEGLRRYLVDGLALRGQALLALDRRAEARTAYAEARAIAEEIGSKRSLWPVLAALARLEAAEGNHAEAYALRRQARVLIEYTADHLDSPDLRASLLNLPDAREVMGLDEAHP